MNILILYNENQKGGLLTNTRILAEGLRSRGNNVVLIGTDGPGTRSILKDQDVRYVNYSNRNPLHVLSQIAHIARENNIDLIHAQNRIPALYASVVCFFNRKIKYVWANHQVPIPSGFLQRIATKYGDGAITGSMAGFRFLTEKLQIPKEKVSVVNLGIDIDRFTPATPEEKKRVKRQYHVDEGEKVILLYGGLYENKGHIFFLQSLEKMKELPAVKIFFPGEGDEAYKERIIACAKAVGVADRIVFPGFVDGRSILSLADLMILPSANEGYPISCIEAYCMGVPVIRTKTGGYEDTERFCTGIDYGDTDGFAKELASFFSRDEKFNEKASLALESRDLFSMDHMISQYIEIYESILKSHGRDNEG